MQIRSFENADADGVNAVALAAFAQYECTYSDWDELARGVGDMAGLARRGEIVVAEVAGRIAGAVAYFGPHVMPRAEIFDPHWPIIRMLVVDPDARGQGIGRRLTEACIDKARRDGADVIALHTSPTMEVALDLYLRLGFELERPVPDRYGVPYAIYVKRL